jgi:hypothetical protein
MSVTILPSEARALGALVAAVGPDAAARMVRPEVVAQALERMWRDLEAINREEDMQIGADVHTDRPEPMHEVTP